VGEFLEEVEGTHRHQPVRVLRKNHELVDQIRRTFNDHADALRLGAGATIAARQQFAQSRA
jgi:hypothetical protein